MVSNSKANTLEERLVRFAVDIAKLVGQLPHNLQAKHIGSQVLRSGTAAAPNYAEARAAESRADFVHKLKICLKELNETSVWLRILARISPGKDDLIVAILQENVEIARIIKASIMTAKARSQAADK